ncbi:MAG: glycosyltransferase [Acidimicrobiales bacterium]
MTASPSAAGHAGTGSRSSRATVAVVVVNHNAGATLDPFLRSVRAEPVTEVVVVDNASTDGSSDGVDADPIVRVVRTGTNLGYGSGANRGLALVGADLVLVSNPDVTVHRGAVALLAAAFAADPTLAIAGPCIRSAAGVRYPSARRFPSMTVAAGHVLLGLVAPQNRFSRRYRMAELDTASPSPLSPGASSPAEPGTAEPGTAEPGIAEPGIGATAVDWVSGACFMARGRALKELGGFDEAFFMYLEDVDLCWRAHRAGWRVAYVPGAEVTHVQGTSTARRPYRMLVAHHRSALLFARRSTQGWRRATVPGVAVMLAVRLAVASTRQALGTLRKTAARAD